MPGHVSRNMILTRQHMPQHVSGNMILTRRHMPGYVLRHVIRYVPFSQGLSEWWPVDSTSEHVNNLYKPFQASNQTKLAF